MEKECSINHIKVKNATKKGYLEAEEGDGIDCSTRMEKHRGTVQKGICQTLTTQDDVGVCVKSKKCDHNCQLCKHFTTSYFCGFEEPICKKLGISLLSKQIPKCDYFEQKVLLRIRKLTPKECMRLMGCKDDSAYEKMKNVAHLTDREIYHIAGDGLIANIPELLIQEIL